MVTLKGKREDWVKLFAVISSYVKETKITVSDGTASIVAIDPANVAIVKANMPCEGECDPFCVKVEQIMKALNAAGGEDVTFSFDEYMSDLTIIGSARVKMPLLADLGEIKDIKRSMFDTISGASSFSPAEVKQCTSYGMFNKEGAVTITIKDNTLTISVGEDRYTAEITTEGATGEAKGTYPLDYFDTLIKQSEGSNVSVKIPHDDFPMLTEWTSGNAEFSIVLAPRVSNE